MSSDTQGSPPVAVVCGPVLEARALPGLPTVAPGADVVALIDQGLERGEIALQDQDVLLVTSKLFSRAEDRFVDLSTLTPSARAMSLAEEVQKDPRLVELILQESVDVSRKKVGALIVRHRLGFISANAGIDASNSEPDDGREGVGPWVLALPEDPDASAKRLSEALWSRHEKRVGVVVTDSWGRPFRRGTAGFCVGLSGVPSVVDQRGQRDRFGRELVATMPAIADQLAALGDLVAGQAAEGTPVVHVRGLEFTSADSSARELVRDIDEDLYA